MMGSKAFENPLLGHARMRALFRALVEARAIPRSLPGSWRAAIALPPKLEACWVGTAIDLRGDDLTSDARGSAMLTHIRGVGLRTGLAKPPARDLRRMLDTPARPFPGSPADRLMCAVGSAIALRAAGRGSVVVAYVSHRDLSRSEWKCLFRTAAEGDLPLIVVAVPSLKPKERPLDLAALAGTAIPVIPTDASDAVALYRVAQEALVRARAEGGTMVIDCIASGLDPILLLADQLVTKRICTRRWIASVVDGMAASAPRPSP